MKKKSVIFSISRGRGRRDFMLEVEPGMSVLDALERIRTGPDPSLMYRHSCHHGSCGTCACVINGRERLACTTRVLDLGMERVTLEPLKKMNLIGDLAVDPSPLFREIPESWDYLRESEPPPRSPVARGRPLATRFENCIECGACVSACPAGGEFQGPASLALLHRELEKHPENRPRLLAQAADERGVPGCVRAYECSRVCPADVQPGRHIAELRKMNENGKG